MELTEEQKQTVRLWANEGLGLSDIQKKINSEFGLSMTYMDVRFMVIDLDVELKEKAGSGRPVQDVSEPVAPQGEEGWESEAPGSEESALNSVSVDLDMVTKPGSVVSGSVTFSDGVKATWFLDQLGRLAINAGQPGYKPDEQDLHVFQNELRVALQKRGF